MHESTMPLILTCVALLVAGGLLVLALRAAMRQRLLESLPTSTTRGVFIGQVELKGTAEASPFLTSYLTGQSCVHYQWSVEESWSRTVTESYRDSQGRSQTRTRRESGWKTVAKGSETLPEFMLHDSEGSIRIRPAGAELALDTALNEVCGREHPLYYGKGPLQSIADSEQRRRFTESLIPLHAPLFVMGRAREREDRVAPEIARDETGGLFLISTKSEERVTSGYRLTFWVLAVLGLVFTLGACLVQQQDAPARPEVYAAAGVGYLAVLLLGWIWMVYNSLVNLRERVRQAWANVDVQLKRRHDLIPMLLAPVAALRDHEQRVQAELALLRSQGSATAPGEPGPDPHPCGVALGVIIERYPELKANDAFLGLQRSLSDTEERISLARGYFNEIATHYNTRLAIIPDRFVAALGRMKPRALMAAESFERQVVRVE